MLNISKNPEALNSFLQIINAYGAVLNNRELVKLFDINIKLDCTISALSFHECDPYSWMAREHGVLDGLTSSNIEDIKKSIKSDFSALKADFVRSLISQEKYYRKLKHLFHEKFPDLYEEMLSDLKGHISYLESKKLEKNSLFNEILNLSDRFMSFFNYTFNGGVGLHLSYQSFSDYVIKKYNINIENEKILEFRKKSEIHIKNPNFKLDFKDINFLNSILSQIVENVSDDDLNNIEIYTASAKTNPDARKVSFSIINKEFARFKKLHFDYVSILNNFN